MIPTRRLLGFDDVVRVAKKTKVAVLLLSLLTGCVTTESEKDQQRANASQAAECINREASLIAPTALDLETASLAVIGKCSYFTNFMRRDMLARYPGHRDYIEPRLREVDEIYMAQARLAVARARASRSQ
jgi:hypothetical protein